MRIVSRPVNMAYVFAGLAAAFIIAWLFVSRPKVPNTPSPIAMNEHTQQVVQFFTQVIGTQTRTQITFNFEFEKEPFPLILSFKQKDQTIKEFFVFHPQVSQLVWPTLKQGDISLLQRQQVFGSFEEFLQTKPLAVLGDDAAKLVYPGVVTHTINTTNAENIDLEAFDYILTSGVPLTLNRTSYTYQNIIDTSAAELNENGEILWVIRAPDAKEGNAFYLGNIDITYLQPL